MGAEDGIEINTAPIQANSRLAFELATFAREAGKADALHRQLFEAYFGRGDNIGDLEVLMAVAEKAGLDVDAARAALEDQRYASLVDEQIAWARDSGITATPTFIFDEQYALVGAQEYATFERMMAKLGHEKVGATGA